MKIFKRPVLVFVLIMGFLALFLALFVPRESEEESWSRSSANPAPRGSRAFFETLEELGVDVIRHRENLEKIPEEVEVLFIIAPKFPISPGEADVLLQWVEEGGTLVLLSGAGEPYKGSFQGIPLRRASYGYEGGSERALYERLRLVIEDDSEERQGPADESYAALLQDELTTSSLLPLIPSPETLNIEKVTVSNSPPIYSAEGEAAALLGDNEGRRIYRRPGGEGQVYFFPSSRPIENRALKEGSNFELLYSIVLWNAPNGFVAVDEYHHGHRVIAELPKALSRPEVKLALGQALLLFLLYIHVRGKRFGPVRPLVRETRRSALEFIRSMANLFERAQAGRAVARVAYEKFRDDLLREAKIPVHLKWREASQVLERRKLRHPQDVARAAQEIPRLLSRTTLGPKDLTELGRRFSLIRKELKHGNPGSTSL